MRTFEDIRAVAAGRKGGDAALEALLARPLPPEALAAIPDDRWLSTLSRGVFVAGFNSRVVDRKWPAFEREFHGFDPSRCQMMEDEAVEKAAKAAGIGHMRKAFSIRENAVEHGSAARAIADWPADDYAGLLLMLKARGNRLGGTAVQYALRAMGRDGFVMTRDVVAALVREGVIDREPTSQRGLRAVQAAFNAWRAESGRPLTQISQTLAFSVGN